MPRPETLDHLAQALGVDVSYFLVPDPEPLAASPLDALNQPDQRLAERVEQVAHAVEKLLEAQQVIAQMAEEDRALLREVAQAVRPDHRRAR